MQRILLVEDDKTIVEGLTYALGQEGFEVYAAYTQAQAADRLRAATFDLALIDLLLPDGSGYDICRFIRRQSPSTRVIFLTACDEETSVVMGLDMGADDYVTKPFRLRELLSRIRTVLRRGGGTGGNELRLGDVVVYTKQAKVVKNGTDVPLSALEYRLLLTFAQNAGQVLTRSRLLEGIWDVAGDFVNDNTLTVYIKRLRDKIEDDPQQPSLIQTVRGLGYRAGE
jgi:two-component system response regulator VicR